MLRILRKYLFWTYERGSVHYDVMVTLILVFIFVSPRVIDYKDKPVARILPASGVLVKSDGQYSLIYQIDADTLSPNLDDKALRKELKAVIAPISGGVNIDHYVPMRGANGNIVAYRVWVRR
ncbi:MAG TPA: hypothetical protein VHX63_17015 [Acidobacteriaceae bacterium]|jgi:hypothetical protein|nr:hypothetical protein [Acidobacteriaceae bacterium]